jgi:hypothetical protein
MSAQLKVGNNPTSLNTNTNLQVEAQSGGQVVITRDSGKLGIGTLSPAAKLDVIGKVKITDGTEGTGKVLVSDANGQASWQNASTLQAINKDSTSASNGLTLSGKEVQLGGTLTKATTITTSATNTIALGGLQSGATSDSILVVNPSSGVIKRISPSALGAATEPWYNVATNNGATANTQDIYQLGFVGIGNATPQANLDVAPASGGAGINVGTIGTASSDQAYITFGSKYNRINGIGSTSNLGWQLGTRGDAWATTTNKNTFHMSYWDGTSWKENMTIQPSGFVGIGTTSPAAQLHVVRSSPSQLLLESTSGNNSVLGIKNSSTGGNTWSLQSTGSSDGNGAGHLLFHDLNNNLSRMIIRSNGNLGIGVTNPSARLEVDGVISTKFNAGIGSVRLSPGIASNSGYIEFFNSNSSTRAGYIGFANNGNFLYTAENGNRHYFQGAGIYIAGSNSYNIGNFVFYSNTVYTSGTNGFYTGVSGASNNGYSIYAVDRIACAEVNIFSDRRVKNVIGTSNANQDLATLMKLSIKDYTMKDFIENGNRKFKKVIAQEVEEVFPQAISQSKNAIPNIFAPAKAQVLENQIELTLSKTHELKSQDTLKIYFAGKEKQIKVLETPNNKTIRISKQDIDLTTLNDVFVYGQYVHDFRTVDYDALSMLNISATQELYRKIEALEKQNQQLLQLQSGFETLKAEIQNLKKDMNKDLSLKNH